MSRQVLVIDFEPRSLETTSTLLEAHGFQVIKAASLSEIDALVDRVDAIPWLIVLEPMLPGLDGFKLCKTLKKSALTGEPPKILVGSRIFQGARYRTMAREAGADLFYKKPTENDLMVETLNRYMASPRSTPAGGIPGASAHLGGSARTRSDESVFSAISDLDVDQALSRTLEPQQVQEQVSPENVADADDQSVLAPAYENVSAAAAPIRASSSESSEDDPLSIGDTFAVPVRPQTGSAAPSAAPTPVAHQPPPTSAGPEPFDPGVSSAEPVAPEIPGTGAADPMAELEMTGEQVLDEILSKALTGSAPSEAALPSQSPSDQAIDDMFSAAPSLPSEPVQEAPVPASLQGMDAGTADLLSSLGELEDSVPPTPNEELQSSSIFPTGEAPVEVETSVPLTPPPPSEAEESLSALFDDPDSGAEFDSGKLLSEIGGAQAISGPLQAVAVTPGLEKKNGSQIPASKRSWWIYLGLAAIVFITSGVGLWLMRDEITGASSPEASGAAALEAALTSTEAGALVMTQPEGEASPTPGQAVQSTGSPEPIDTPEEPPPPTAEQIAQQQQAVKRARAARATQARLRREKAAASQALLEVESVTDALSGQSQEALLDPSLGDAGEFELAFSEEINIGEAAAPPAFEPQIAGVNGVSIPRVIVSTQIEAVYPPHAQRLSLEGKVVLQAVILRDGSVGDISILSKPPGKFGFDKAAMEAVSQWRYQPAKRNGRPVDSFATVTIRFSR